jgi:hypothetical protein
VTGFVRRSRPERTEERTGLFGTIVMASALFPGFLAVSALHGVGLARPIPEPLSLLLALFAYVLPVLGLASAARGRGGAIGIAGWAWAALVLSALPLYFPGERAVALQDGGRALLSPLPAALATRAFAFPDGAAQILGPGPEQPPLAEEIAMAPSVAARTDEDGGIVLPYAGSAGSMRIEVRAAGPETTLMLPMLFDTGATLTTLDRATLSELGIPVPADAPTASLRTAGGLVEAPLVLLPSVGIGDAERAPVTVAVCEPCAEGDVRGLLGLNVSGRFQVALDHDAREVRLAPRPDGGDDHLDVLPWVDLSSRATAWPDGRVQVDVTAASRAPLDVDELVAEVTCADRSFAVALTGLPKGGVRSAKATLPRGVDCTVYTVAAATARWAAAR